MQLGLYGTHHVVHAMLIEAPGEAGMQASARMHQACVGNNRGALPRRSAGQGAAVRTRMLRGPLPHLCRSRRAVARLAVARLSAAAGPRAARIRGSYKARRARGAARLQHS